MNAVTPVEGIVINKGYQMNDKKTIKRKPAGAFPNTPQGWADYEAQFDFSPDELYANRPPTWNGEDDEPEEEWRVGEDFQEDDDE